MIELRCLKRFSLFFVHELCKSEDKIPFSLAIRYVIDMLCKA